MIVSISSFVLLAAALLAQTPSRPAEKGAMEKPASAAKAQSIYDFTAKAIAGKVQWNFQKHLIGRDGTVHAKFGTKTMPEDPKIIDAVEKALAAPKP